VPACVNPDHLFLGTHTENMQDMTKKGRHPYKRGQSHPNAVLTEDDVRAIRASDENYTSLGRRYGICKNNVYLIRARQAWGHVP
jgi:RNA:NAD 2'-phosphotransferase (TPT1/KptA family)